MLISGLDLSTTVAGYSTFEDGDLREYNWWKFDKPDGYTNLDLVRQFDEEVWPHIKDSDKVILEDSLKKYAGGFSSKKTISKLVRFNGIIEYELRKRLGKENVIKYHPATARKNALGRGTKPSGYEDSKEWILEKVSEEFDIEWELTYADNPRPGSEDAADSIILAKAYIEENLK